MSTSSRCQALSRAEQVRVLGDNDLLGQALAAAGVALSGVEVFHGRQQGDGEAVLGLRLHGVPGQTAPDGSFASLWTGSEARLERLIEKSHGAPVVPVPTLQALLFPFPGDPRLPILARWHEPSHRKRLLNRLPMFKTSGERVRARGTSVTTLRYKPGHRFIGRADLRVVDTVTGGHRQLPAVVRLFRDRRGGRIEAILQRLQGVPDLRVPRPLGTAAGGRLVAEEFLVGKDPCHLAERGALTEALGKALAALHRVPVARLQDMLPARGSPPFAASLDALRASRLVEPGRLRGLEALFDRRAGTVAVLHGDLHLHQVLWTPQGPALVDFERVCLGAPAQDLGALCAHVALGAGLDSFAADVIECYRQAGGQVSDDDLAAYTAGALVQRAATVLRQLGPTGHKRSRIAHLLDLADGLPTARRSRTPRRFFAADSETRWASFTPRPSGPWPGHLLLADGGKEYGLYSPGEDRFLPSDPARDPHLPELGAWLERGTLVSYRPGKRATVRLQERGSVRYAKLLRPGRAATIAANLGTLESLAAASSVALPAVPVLESAPAPGVLVFGTVPGTTLHQVLTGGAENRDDALGATAAAMARFHGVRVRDGALPAARPHPEPEVWVRALAAHDQHLARAAEAVARLLTEPGPGGGPADRLVHGDLHDKNIAVQGLGIGLLDLDAVGRGDPKEDVGNLVAHLILRAQQRAGDVTEGRRQAHLFLARYEAEAGPVGGVCQVTARTLLRLACLYRFRRRWLQVPTPLLAEARAWCEGRPC